MLRKAHVSHSSATITSLPYDILYDLFTYLDSEDIVRLLSTSRILHVYMHDDGIWRMLSARHGVKDMSGFGPEYTWYEVYTRLLYNYGPLLGLWASDVPFQGLIIECRINMDGLWHGIIGEIWKLFPSRDQESDRDPCLPSYLELFRVCLRKRANDCLTELRWRTNGGFISSNEGYNTPSLNFVSSTNQATFVSINQGLLGGPLRHPDFPAPNTPWYDGNREIPRRLEQPTPECSDSRDLVRLDFRNRHTFMYTMKVDHTFPPALNIHFPEHQKGLLHRVAPIIHLFRDFRFVNTETADDSSSSAMYVEDRYYPLHNLPQRPFSEPIGSSGWDPRTLEGLWLGAYGVHGTEVLYLQWDSAAKRILSWKVTGDLNVPRGVVSWQCDVPDPGKSCPGDIPPNTFDRLQPKIVYSGKGTISDIGFLESDNTVVHVAIITDDDIRVCWPDLESVSRFRRYKGRDVSSEYVDLENGVRRPTYGFSP